MNPRILTTWSFGLPAGSVAFARLDAGGSALDAVEDVCRHVELDPAVDSVGFGGLPDASGRVSLDACIMQGPSRVGSVAGLRHHLHAVTVARLVMERSPHVLLVGEEADDFADGEGLERSKLLAPSARRAWEAWKADAGSDSSSPQEGSFEVRGTDTVSSLALDGSGRLAGACTSSGARFKTPGRVGDSPIIGQGLYVDPEVGAVCATGHGELIMGLCSTFLVAEGLRAGLAPVQALAAALARFPAAYELRPEHQVGLIALCPDGSSATASLRTGFRVAEHTAAGSRLLEPDYVLLDGHVPE